MGTSRPRPRMTWGASLKGAGFASDAGCSSCSCSHPGPPASLLLGRDQGLCMSEMSPVPQGLCSGQWPCPARSPLPRPLRPPPSSFRTESPVKPNLGVEGPSFLCPLTSPVAVTPQLWRALCWWGDSLQASECFLLSRKQEGFKVDTGKIVGG